MFGLVSTFFAVLLLAATLSAWSRRSMSDVLPQLGVVFVLVVINAAFAVSELALVALREGQLQRVVLDRLGRIPAVGDHVSVDDWHIEIRSMERHRVTEVALAPAVPAPELPSISMEPTTQESS